MTGETPVPGDQAGLLPFGAAASALFARAIPVEIATERASKSFTTD